MIVSDVPVLDAAHEDEARRFIALVDELYDRNVNLVVSAAAAPAQLYAGSGCTRSSSAPPAASSRCRARPTWRANTVPEVR